LGLWFSRLTVYPLYDRVPWYSMMRTWKYGAVNSWALRALKALDRQNCYAYWRDESVRYGGPW
jgi:hypothetical protein